MAKLTKVKAKEIKTCVKCGIVFEKNPRASSRQWSLRKYCSFGCRKLTKSERDTKKALRTYQSLKDKGLCPWCHTPNTDGGVYHKRCGQKRYERYRSSRKNNSLMMLYNISLEKYTTILKSQDGKCAICSGTSGKRSLSVDHNHNSGQIRGLLCDNCNHGLGKFQDNKELLMEAIRYLESNGKEINET